MQDDIAAISRRSFIVGCGISIGFFPVKKKELKLAIADLNHSSEDAPSDIDRRLAIYKDLGFNAIRLPISWSMFEPVENDWGLSKNKRRYFELVLNKGFELKAEIGAWSYAPDWFLEKNQRARMLDDAGRFKRQYISLWYPEAENIIKEKQSKVIRSLSDHGFLRSIYGGIIDLGPAGEPIYPAAWSVPGETKNSFWFYGETAAAAFQIYVKEQFGDEMRNVNKRWRTHFNSWSQVNPTLSANYAYYHDVLSWYRQSKRDMIVSITKSFLEDIHDLSPTTRPILLLPGSHQTENYFEASKSMQTATDNIKIMNDWVFFFDLCVSLGIDIQYTAAEEAKEIAYLYSTLKQRRYSGAIWLENAGGLPASQPEMLAHIAADVAYRGYDYIGAGIVFPDRLTLDTSIGNRIKSALQLMNQHAVCEKLK